MSKSNIRWLHQQLPDLVDARIIDEAAQARVQAHYDMDMLEDQNPLSLITIILAAIGGLLVGGGVILIFAHNWQDLARPTRTALAFTPLVFTQIITLIALFPNPRGQAWREVSGALLFCAVPASIALIGQTYHISNDTQAFLSWWFVLVLPFVYFLRAHLLAILMMVLATSLATMYYNSQYWLCLVALFPYYWLLHKDGASTRLLQSGWILALCLALVLPVNIIDRDIQAFDMLALVAGATGMYLLGGNIEIKNTFWGRPLTNISAIALSVCGLSLSFRKFWSNLIPYKGSPEFIGAEAVELGVWQLPFLEWVLIGLAIFMLGVTLRQKRLYLAPLCSVLLLYSISMLLPFTLWSPTAHAVIFNIAMIAVGIWYVYLGVQNNSASQLNFGLLLIMALLTMRFFDQDLTFIARGVAFILMGIVLIGINVWHGRRSAI